MKRRGWLGLVLAAGCMLPGPSPRLPGPSRTLVERADESSKARAPAPEPPSPEEPTAMLYSKRLDFRRGEPQVRIRLMEGREEVTFSPLGRMRMRVQGPLEKLLEAPQGSWWTVRITQGEPATTTTWIQLAELPFADRAGLAAEQKAWRDRGFKVRVHTLGAIHGIGGKVIDNRRYLLLLDEPLSPEAASARQAALLRDLGARTSRFEELGKRSRGILEVLDERGSSVAVGQDLILADCPDGEGFAIRKVEYGVGYDFHGFEDRRYRGALELTVDRQGKLAVVNRLPLEELLKGLVPAEIYARAHPQALMAQAVTARGEVLAKVGLKHLADPYLLCSEQHCAVYRGLTGEDPATSAAVEATRGEGLFSAGGKLVDSVYSAVCGGHTEDNDVVWGGPPDPNLRGKPDVLHPQTQPPLPDPGDVADFLAADAPAACRLSSFAQPTKYRWERRFAAAEVDSLAAHLGIGPVQAISVTDRGVSGRARVLSLSGERGATQVRGELNIRRLFGMLNSAMFVVAPELTPDGKLTGWLFRGGGWGHGVGMCQTGAIGRAEAGQTYQEILRHYFSGATVAPLY